MSATLALELEELDVAYRVRGIDRQVLRGVSLAVRPGETVGLVGESGCGKSTAALAAIRYLPRNGRLRGGRVTIAGKDVWSLTRRELRAFYASDVGMVYQNPASSLNPSLRIGRQVAEVFEVRGASGGEARDRSREALARVQIADPGSVLERYPHQLSGGMQQRVVIAMALAKSPALLVLDEPTTGLDATVEAEVLDLIAGLRDEIETAVLFISHNLALIGRMCDRVGVLYAGRIVEEGETQRVLQDPRHPYTVGLLRCVPRGGLRKDVARLDTIPGFLPDLGSWIQGCVFADRCGLAEDVCRTDEPELLAVGGTHRSRCHFHDRAQTLPRADDAPVAVRAATASEPLLRFDGVGKVFRQHGQEIQALSDVTAEIKPGETLGLVGESGSGKTTLAKALLGIIEPSTGSVTLEGRDLAPRLADRDRNDIRALQIVFQNPGQALNRRHSVRRILRRTLRKLAGLTGRAADERLERLVREVRLSDRYLTARPRQLSGGLQQRVAIARAFAGSPRLVVCDEPTSALDVSVQAAILNLLADLQAEEGTAYLFISHDLGVVRYLSDRIAVLYLGRLMEVGPAGDVFAGPHHPYTEALLSAVPRLDGTVRERIRLSGEIPSAASPPSGCVFHTRCPRNLGAICEEQEPELLEVAPGRTMRCHIPLDELRRLQAPSPDEIEVEA
jgi:peptide/nickel transport system ATP-binding protein